MKVNPKWNVNENLNRVCNKRQERGFQTPISKLFRRCLLKMLKRMAEINLNH